MNEIERQRARKGVEYRYRHVVYVTCQMQSDKLFGKLKLMLAHLFHLILTRCNNHVFDRIALMQLYEMRSLVHSCTHTHTHPQRCFLNVDFEHIEKTKSTKHTIEHFAIQCHTESTIESSKCEFTYGFNGKQFQHQVDFPSILGIMSILEIWFSLSLLRWLDTTFGY